MRVHRAIRTAHFILLILCVLGLAASTSLAKDKEEDTRPERGITMNFEYPEVIINKGEEVTVDLIVKNRGKRDENVYFMHTAPAGWKTKIKTYSFSISSIHVPEDSEKSVQFAAEPEKDTTPGTYTFTVNGRTEDGTLRVSHTLKITMRAGKVEEKGEIELTTSYPVLRGPNDAKFEFSIELKNKTDKEDTFTLNAQVPKNWRANFKPPYEDKYISSVRLKDNESKSLNVEVTPDRYCEAGEHLIPITVSAGETTAEAELKVIITGTYKLEAGTPTGLLSLETEKGEPGNLSIYVKNSGSATIPNVEFLSVKPENWTVEFTPETIEYIEPGDLKQVEVSITPAEEALVGDYAVGLNIRGERTSDSLEMRVTVKASAAWGWVGIGIIVLVILGLFGLFVTLGRR
jgi:uncharacterized membrane protein